MQGRTIKKKEYGLLIAVNYTPSDKDVLVLDHEMNLVPVKRFVLKRYVPEDDKGDKRTRASVKIGRHVLQQVDVVEQFMTNNNLTEEEFAIVMDELVISVKWYAERLKERKFLDKCYVKCGISGGPVNKLRRDEVFTTIGTYNNMIHFVKVSEEMLSK